MEIHELLHNSQCGRMGSSPATLEAQLLGRIWLRWVKCWLFVLESFDSLLDFELVIPEVPDRFVQLVLAKSNRGHASISEPVPADSCRVGREHQ